MSGADLDLVGDDAAWDAISQEAQAQRRRVNVAVRAGIREFVHPSTNDIATLTPSLIKEGGMRMTRFNSILLLPLGHTEVDGEGAAALTSELLMFGFTVPAEGALDRAQREVWG